MTQTNPTTAPQHELKHDSVGLLGTLAASLANIAPAISIFLVTATMVGALGSLAPWVYALGAVAVLTSCNTLFQFTRRMPSAGSWITFINRGYGSVSPRLGTVLSAMTFYLLLLVYPVSMGGILTFFGNWVATYAGWGGYAWLVIAVGALAVAQPLLARGLGLSTTASFVLFLAEAGGLLVLSAVIFIHSGDSITVPIHRVGGSPGLAGVSGLVFPLAVFAYAGWENAGTLGEESRDPKRIIPRSLLLSVTIAGAIMFVCTWAAVVGYAHWHGGNRGMGLLGNSASPFVDLANHYAPAISWFVFAIGLVSGFSCFLASGIPFSRYVFHAARGGLLPGFVFRVSRSGGVPVAVWSYILLTALACILPALLTSNASTIATIQGGAATGPLLIIYVLANVALPLFIRRTAPAEFSWIWHLLIPAIGTFVVVFGMWRNLKPGQAAPADTYWMYALAFIVVAALGTAIALARGGRQAHLVLSGDDAAIEPAGAQQSPTPEAAV